jgi:hypothetical protein
LLRDFSPTVSGGAAAKSSFRLSLSDGRTEVEEDEVFGHAVS